MHWYQYLSDVNLAQLLDTLKSEYFMATTAGLVMLGCLAKKTKAKWDDKAVTWLKGKLGR